MTETTGTIAEQGNPGRLSKLARHLSARATAEEGEIDGKEIAAQMAEQILSADSVDDILSIGESGIIGGRDLVDVEQRIFRFTVRTGKKEDISNPYVGGVYLVVEAQRLDNGQPLVWDTSATQLVTQLVAIERKDAEAEAAGSPRVFPIDVVIKDVGGKGALALRKVVRRAVQ